ncbi:hypothetical protein AB433_00415 [Croceicoccus naphthovorans]|uniref:Uncharacterized protein n=1 Tax=Croceicoccus naphthovorans TaxID=1348774 RepID=A0A0G3XDX2_9SPHN|nr:hypothetical protein AB433_00415 [Croceicoccus naphthovorans]
MSTTNSSPPNLATVASILVIRVNLSATPTRSWSPATCPRRSLTALKRLRSSKTSRNGRSLPHSANSEAS